MLLLLMGGLVASGVMTVIFLLLDLLGAGDSGGREYGWSGYSLGFFLGFAIFVTWALLEQYRRIDRLASQRPSIRTQHGVGAGDWGIDVFNDGADGVFQAQVEILSVEGSDAGMPDNRRYAGHWEDHPEPGVQIPRGFSRRLVLARMSQGQPAGENVDERMARMVETASSLQLWGVTRYGPTHVMSVRSDESGPAGRAMPGASLKVTITSEPEPANVLKPLEFHIRAGGTFDPIGPESPESITDRLISKILGG